MATKQRISLCIFDLDNTLFDWVAMWHAMFSAMLGEVSRISGISTEQLKPEFRAVHRRHGTSEYPFAIEELPSVLARHSGQDLRNLFDPAMHAYYSARKRTLALYPGVFDVLQTLRKRGVRLIAYTESMAFYSAQRLITLGLDELIEALYSPQDHQLPKNAKPEEIRQYSAEHYKLRITAHRHTPPGALKPNPAVLESILRDAGVPKANTIYVRDSRMKDISMANEVGVTSVWAAYGESVGRAEYVLLKEVTHWSDADVKREQAISNTFADPEKRWELVPTFTLNTGLHELLELFDFVPAPKDAEKNGR